MGCPQNAWFIGETPTKMDDLGYPYDLGNLHLPKNYQRVIIIPKTRLPIASRIDVEAISIHSFQDVKSGEEVL